MNETVAENSANANNIVRHLRWCTLLLKISTNIFLCIITFCFVYWVTVKGISNPSHLNSVGIVHVEGMLENIGTEEDPYFHQFCLDRFQDGNITKQEYSEILKEYQRAVVRKHKRLQTAI